MKLLKLLKQEKNRFYIVVGILAVLAGSIPTLLLGKGAVLPYHDQLDGEIFTYILQAKHLFDGGNTYPELMNGIPRTGMQVPAPLMTLFFCVLSPLSAMVVCNVLIAMAAFVGMFLCLNRIIQQKLISFLIGMIFAYLPFFTVYGLSVMGIPLLLYEFDKLYRKENMPGSYLLIALYGITSSFVLVGFAVIGAAGVLLAAMVPWRMKSAHRKSSRSVQFTGSVSACAVGLLLLLLIYIICNTALFGQALGIGAGEIVSHKEEIVVNAVPLGETIQELLIDGQMHAKGLQKFMLLPIGLVLVIGAIAYRKKMNSEQKTLYKWLSALTLANVVIILFAAFYRQKIIVDIRNQIGGAVKYFQLDRIYWLMPAVWYLAFGISLALIGSLLYKQRKIWAYLIIGVCILISGCYVLWNSSFKVNVRQLMNPRTSNSVTWRLFYSEDLFREIDEYIRKPKEDYRILSLGIHPAAALYNGFYCLDGYSNNYDLEYKYEFRGIIAPELERSEYLKQYFDGWGNRCYVLASEIGDSFMLSKKDHAVITELDIDVEKARSMGAEYLFSGAEIMNAEESGLQLERYFESEEGYYGIYLYKF